MKTLITDKLSRYFAVTPDEATEEQIYKSTVLAVKEILTAKRQRFKKKSIEQDQKRVYYLCMEFLMGRSLKLNLCNLGLEDDAKSALRELGFDLDTIYEFEDDAGLGNGGLGRLAACFMDSLSSLGYPAMGFSICYEYGLFRQKIVGGEQIELPDVWMPSGEGWLVQRQDKAKKIRLGGRIKEDWSSGHLTIIHTDYDEIEAVPYDMMVSGADGECVNVLRLWKAQDIRNFNMKLFSQGQYLKAVEDNANAQMISKVLYPADNHTEGKLLRLSQQYFLVSASLQNIISEHIYNYKTLSNLADKVAIHINDTHPALAIPELMRILMDEYGYSWEQSWDITTRTMSYTNHTVLPEALECWNEDLFRLKLPRIYNIIHEINERFCADAWNKYTGNWNKIGRMSIIEGGQVKMANLSVIGSHTVNGVSALHSEILKKSVFNDFYTMYPDRFTNVTNGIAHRKWLCYSNRGLSSLLDECIGPDYRNEPEKLEGFLKYKDDKTVLDQLGKIKRANKEAFSNWYKGVSGIALDPDSLFDVQAKRLHEYKRQLLNVLHIISHYVKLKENPNAPLQPRTFLFAAKAAPGYYHAKEIIKLICFISNDVEKDPVLREKMRVVFLENYNVSMAERLMPAAELSEQISLAGKEASGTGNMKFMINGAVTIGTLDGANVEIHQEVGDENIFLFGMTTPEVEALWNSGYESHVYYSRSELLQKVINRLNVGFDGKSFSNIVNYLLFSHGIADPYMCLADFDSYVSTQLAVDKLYKDKTEWNKKCLVNIAKAGFFAADRSIGEYADNIWHLNKVK